MLLVWNIVLYREYTYGSRGSLERNALTILKCSSNLSHMSTTAECWLVICTRGKSIHLEILLFVVEFKPLNDFLYGILETTHTICPGLFNRTRWPWYLRLGRQAYLAARPWASSCSVTKLLLSVSACWYSLCVSSLVRSEPKACSGRRTKSWDSCNVRKHA